MSVILRDRYGKIKLYCKGADNVILQRALKKDNMFDYTDITIEHLESFAKEGFRTLVLAYREISEEEYSVNILDIQLIIFYYSNISLIKQAWHKIYYRAATSIQNRDEKLQEAAELIEKNLIVLGATRIEDKLQIVIVFKFDQQIK